MPVNIQGYKGVVQLPQSMTYTPQKGWATTAAWRGPEQSIKSLAVSVQSYYGSAVTMTLDPEEAGIALLTVQYDDAADGNNDAKGNGEPQEDSDVWTLAGSDIELDIYTHPKLTDLATNYPTEYHWLRTNLKAIESNQTWIEVINAYTAVGPQHDEVRDILDMMMNGITSYRKSTWVLKRSRTVGSQKQGTIAMSNINRIFSYSNMLSMEALPSSLKFGIDTNLEWLKGTPSVTMNGNKMVVENEYTGADWDSRLYYYAS